MKIYKFPIFDGENCYWKPGSQAEAEGKPQVYQPIDLDYIVSIGPVGIREFSGSDIGESFCSFPIYIKIGNAFDVVYMSGSHHKCPTVLIEKMLQEREKLIVAWEIADEKS